MKKSESLIPRDWFNRADKDMESAEILLKNQRLLENGIYLLQQTVEKYLKGYLLSNGWKLRRIHELEELLNEAIDFEPDFKDFLSLCQKLTEYYIETRYPLGIYTSCDIKEAREYLQETKQLVGFIKKRVR